MRPVWPGTAQANVSPRMLRKLVQQLLLVALVLLGLAAALFGYMLYQERQAKELAITLCDSIKAGDEPADVLARAASAGALRSSLIWLPPDSSPKTLEALFKGGLPLSAHGCRIEASDRVTKAVYFHRR